MNSTIKRQGNWLAQLSIVLLMVIISACGDDNESSQSSQNQIIGEWELETFDGVRVSRLDFTLTVETEPDGDYTERWRFESGNSLTFRGEWEAGEDYIEIRYDDGDEAEFGIIRLSNSELILLDEEDVEWEFIKN